MTLTALQTAYLKSSFWLLALAHAEFVKARVHYHVLGCATPFSGKRLTLDALCYARNGRKIDQFLPQSKAQFFFAFA